LTTKVNSEMSTDALSSCLEDLVKFSSINSRAIDANVVAFLKDVGIPFYFGLKFDPWALLYNNSVNELLMFNNLSYLVIWKGVLGVNICLSQETIPSPKMRGEKKQGNQVK